MGFALHSPAFEAGGAIPDRHLRAGLNLSPPLRWTDPPAGTRSFVLLVEDPNPPHGVVHLWAAHGIRPDRSELREGADAQVLEFHQALNDFGRRRYDGPEPPPGPGVYHYHFILAALDVPEIEVADNATAGDVWEAAHPHVIDRAERIGIVERL